MDRRGVPSVENPAESPGLPGDPVSESGRQPVRWRSRLLAGTCTVAAHLVVFTALFWPHHAPPLPPQPAPLMLSLVETPTPAPPAPPDPELLKPQTVVQPALPHVTVRAISIATTQAPDNSDLLSPSQIAGAASADGEGAGGGGGGCDTARRVQQALQRDPLVRTAVEDAHRQGKSVMLWNGDWVRTGGQDGKGLSAVREAIMWELAFSPKACRNRPVHGLVLLSLADGNTRFAVGAGDWRWSDLLGVR